MIGILLEKKCWHRLYYLSWLLLFTTQSAFGFVDWGKTGHHIIAKVAETRLTKTAHAKISDLLASASLVEVSSFADEIRSKPTYRKYASWHYVNIPDGQSYRAGKKNPKGDLIQAITHCINQIKRSESSREEKAFFLKLLIHFVGDAHQPLHVGRANDRGGNTIRLQWFGKQTNLHRIWDNHLIDHYLNVPAAPYGLPQWTKSKERRVARAPLMQWIKESQDYARLIYTEISGQKKLGDAYYTQHIAGVQTQIFKGGIRLAHLLNELFA